ncbi:MAG: hypothetical protein ISS52_06980 [Dehalococcoidia bacterium]|nr:hypothetical protein [Dehalococcoidia bacterium]
MTWWQYTSSIVVPLFIALLSVWLAYRLSTRREYQKAIRIVKHEIAHNIRICDLICKEIDDDISSRQVRIVDFSMLRGIVWDACKGNIAFKNPQVAEEVEQTYFGVAEVNRQLDVIKKVKWEVVSQVPPSRQSKLNLKEKDIKTLKLVKEFILEKLLPKLNSSKELLDKIKV